MQSDGKKKEQLNGILLSLAGSPWKETYMSTKTISITEDVYGMLLLEKRENESFSDVISRLVKGRSKLSDSFGKWEMTDEEIEEFKSELHHMWQEWQLCGNIQGGSKHIRQWMVCHLHDWRQRQRWIARHCGWVSNLFRSHIQQWMYSSLG